MPLGQLPPPPPPRGKENCFSFLSFFLSRGSTGSLGTASLVQDNNNFADRDKQQSSVLPVILRYVQHGRKTLFVGAACLAASVVRATSRANCDSGEAAADANKKESKFG